MLKIAFHNFRCDITWSSDGLLNTRKIIHIRRAAQIIIYIDRNAFFENNIPLVVAACEKGGGKIAGAPTGLYFKWDTTTSTTEMATVVPFSGELKASGSMEVIKVPAAKSLTINYMGGYSGLGNAHNAMDAYIASNKLEHVAPVIEEYLTGPATEPDSMKWVTKIVYFVK